jgi:hypothetical protein
MFVAAAPLGFSCEDMQFRLGFTRSFWVLGLLEKRLIRQPTVHFGFGYEQKQTSV